MKLSVIIVNYNVRYFLEQCLHSVEDACRNISSEIFVVDNNSVDGSMSMVHEKFPNVQCIENQENVGFSKANNQALRIATGEYVLLLNPDTVVEKDTFTLALQFMDAHLQAGGLGVKMIDGKGRFLPESKRGLPTPAVAFYKIFGLAALFPRSRIFGSYHLGYLDPDAIHPVDVLSGAFMMLRKSALETTGLLDEDFFMYGEDIDLSYRLTQAGYTNYYFPHTRIIHYKGESTKKSSVNYVFTFYRAMVIFAGKHFSHQNARLFSILIHIAIYLRASLAVVTRGLGRILLPLTDALMLFGGLFLIKGWWESILFPWGGHYPAGFIYGAVPAYILIWLFSVFLTGGYERPVRIMKIIQGFTVGTLVILVLYSLLDESLRFSRAMIFFGLLWGLFAAVVIRLLLHYVFRSSAHALGSAVNKRFLIIGEKDEASRVATLVRDALLHPGFIGLVSPGDCAVSEERYIGHVGQIREIIKIYRIEEVIFCARDFPASRIIDIMSEHRDLLVEFKIAPPESLSIIGSNNINTAEDLYVIDIDSVNKIENRRKKRLLDIGLSVCLLLISPLFIWFTHSPAGFLRNIFLVFFGRRSWVGYSQLQARKTSFLPGIRPGILGPHNLLPGHQLDEETIHRLNLLYARDYKLSTDVKIFVMNLRDTGRKG